MPKQQPANTIGVTRNPFTKVTSLVLTISVLIYGLVVRIATITDFKIYKDSYKFLLLARAFQQGQPISEIYPNYPDFLGVVFYKWLYPFLIGITARIVEFFQFDKGNFLSNNYFEYIANAIVILSSIATLFILYKICKSLKFTKIQTLGTLILFWLSGTQIIWNRFIITDTLAGLIVAIVFYIWVRILENPRKQSLKTRVSLWLSCIAAAICRPELAVLLVFPIVVSLPNNATTKSALTFHKWTRISWGAFVLITAISFIFSKIFTRNISGDILLWGLIALLAVDVFLKKTDKSIVIPTYAALTVGILELIYFLFNPYISRYIVILMPLLTILGGYSLGFTIRDTIKNLNSVPSKLQRYMGKSAILVTAGTLIVIQFISPFLAGPSEEKDYQGEVAEKVCDYIDKETKKTPGSIEILVKQEEAFLWEEKCHDYDIQYYKEGIPESDADMIFIVFEKHAISDVERAAIIGDYKGNLFYEMSFVTKGLYRDGTVVESDTEVEVLEFVR
ncbi:hypothetical protein JW710_02280 [Candidatus Dojkabacteria bacterium]|nr:hypothetical protein [Candidatus Dojkabacteria bacterium]